MDAAQAVQPQQSMQDAALEFLRNRFGLSDITKLAADFDMIVVMGAFGEQMYNRGVAAPVSPERVAALEALWVAVKDWGKDGLGYTPLMAPAVKRLRELEGE